MTKPAELEKITTEGNGLSELKLIWGVTSIAALIGRTERQTFHMLQNGLLQPEKLVIVGLSNAVS